MQNSQHDKELTSYKRTLKRRIDDFDAFLDSVIVSCRETELTPEKKAERVARTKNNPAEFCRTYFADIFDLPDNRLVKEIDSLQVGEFYVSGHRKAGKTARVICGKIIYRIAVKKSGMIGYNCRIPKLSQNRIGAIIRILRRHKLLQYDYGIKFERESIEYAIINSVHIIASGCKTGLRAMLADNFKRFDLIVSDDLTDKQSGKADKDAAIDFLEHEVGGQLNDDGLAIALFNDTEPDSPGVIMRERYPDRAIVFPALDENGQSNWPEYKTTEEWDEFRRGTAYTVWMGDYMCNPVQDGGNFEITWFHYRRVPKNDIIASITAVDPARGQSPSACFKAAVTAGITRDMQMWIIDLWIRHERWENFFSWVDKNRRYWPNWKTILFENDFQQWDLAEPYYQIWKQRNDTSLPIYRHLTKELGTKYFSTDKDSRILNLVKPHQDGEIIYNEALRNDKEMEILKHQLLGYGADKEKKDGPDAMATAYILLPRYVKRGNFQPLKERVFGGLSRFTGKFC